MTQEFSGFTLLPQPVDTREREARAVVELIQRHAGTIITAGPGEGRHLVAQRAAALAGVPRVPTLDCTRNTRAAQLRSWFKAHANSPIVLLGDADLLPTDSVPILETVLTEARTALLITCAPWVLHPSEPAPAGSVPALLAEWWRSRRLAHMELGPLTPVELARNTERVVDCSGLDTLQLAAICIGAHGSAALAADLAADASGHPARASRHLSAAWNHGSPISTGTRARLRERLHRHPDDLIRAAASIQGLGALDSDTAAMLLGRDAVSRLLSAGLAFSPTPGTIDIDFFVVAALSTDQAHQQASAEIMQRLDRAYRYDPSLPPGCLLALAEHRIMTDAVGHDPALFVLAARAAVRLGHPQRGLKFARVAQELGGLDDVLSTVWHAKLQLDLHLEVLTEAEAVWREDPEAFGLDHLNAALTAASWAATIPAWLLEIVDRLPDPVAEIIDVLLERQRLDEATARRLLRLARDPGTAVHTRHAAFVLVLWQHLISGDRRSLENTIDLARSFSASRPQNVGLRETQTEYQARQAFTLMLSASRMFSGISQASARARTHDLNVAAAGLGRTSGQLASTTAAFLNGISWYTAGDPGASARDLATVADRMNRSLFRSINVMLSAFRSLRPEPTSALDAEDHGRLHYLTRPQGSVVATRPATLPSWMRVEGQLGATRGLGDAALAAAEDLLRATTWVDLPAAANLHEYLKAKVALDPDRLFSAAEALIETGQMASALDALTCAKEIQLQRRSAVGALACAEVLQRYVPEAPKPAPRQSRPPRRRHKVAASTEGKTPPSGLSDRELQVCLLVAEGLTNPEIAERLVLSTRTVESHVLQARSKLNAKRRADLPDRLRIAWDRQG